VGVQRGNATGISQFSYSSTGDMVYIPGPATGTALTLAVRDRKQGESLELLKLKSRSYAYPRVSPNGKRIAFSTEDDKDSNVWIYDRGTSALVPLTSGSANRYPVWVDNERVAFQSDREGDLGIYWQRADGNDTAVRLTRPNPGVAHIPDSGSPDGQTLSFTAVSRSDRAVWTYSIKDEKATAFAEKSSFSIGWSSFSPDGKWLAYQSDESGKGPQVFVEPFPRTGIKFHLDTWAGQPVWSPSRERPEIFYNPGPGQIAVVNITIGPTSFSFGEPMSVPRGLANRDPGLEPRFWDITADGRQLIGVSQTTSGSPGAPQINVILNWFEELRQLTSTH
jgi:WD40 repeat protein